MSDLTKAMRAEIERLEVELKDLKRSLKARERSETFRNIVPGPGTRFAGKRPLHAIQEILEEHGKPMPKAVLAKMLMDGGISIGKSRQGTNVEEGILRSIQAGSLTMTGRDEMIGLPEWKKK